MTKFITVSALTAALAIGAVAHANAWERSGKFTGARGTHTVDSSGNCSGGACTRSIKRTNPLGRTVTRQGDASCDNGSCSGTRTTTGPNGESITREGSVTR